MTHIVQTPRQVAQEKDPLSLASVTIVSWCPGQLVGVRFGEASTADNRVQIGCEQFGLCTLSWFSDGSIEAAAPVNPNNAKLKFNILEDPDRTAAITSIVKRVNRQEAILSGEFVPVMVAHHLGLIGCPIGRGGQGEDYLIEPAVADGAPQRLQCKNLFGDSPLITGSSARARGEDPLPLLINQIGTIYDILLLVDRVENEASRGVVRRAVALAKERYSESQVVVVPQRALALYGLEPIVRSYSGKKFEDDFDRVCAFSVLRELWSAGVCSLFESLPSELRSSLEATGLILKVKEFADVAQYSRDLTDVTNF